MIRRFRPWSLRGHALGIALAVVLSPLLVVISTNWFEALWGDRHLGADMDTVGALSKAIDSGASDEAITALATKLAKERHQLVRVVDASGRAIVTANRWIGDDWLYSLGDLFYGPDRAHAQQSWEEARPPLAERAEVTGPGRCFFSSAGNLYICAAGAQVVSPAGERRIVHAQSASRRALQPLYEARRQLVKLGLFAAALGLALAIWTSARLVKPVERLRVQVLRSAHRAVPGSVIDLRRKDELGDLAEAFNTVLSALAERRSSNERFLAELAHEFKNPVAAIRATAERLPQTRPDDTRRLERLASVLHQSTLRLDALLTQLLELARAEAGLQEEPRESFDYAAAVRGVCASLALDPRYQDVRIQVFTAASPVIIDGVPSRIESAVRNLVDNAASFAGAGGTVDVRLLSSGSEAVLTVTDSGPGIAPEDLPRIFDRFFTTRRAASGTGLGLSVVRAVVEAHAGRVEVTSTPGEGATFTVHLPCPSESFLPLSGAAMPAS